METDLDTTRNCNDSITESFEELFREYKRRVLLSRICMVFSFLLFALATVFVTLFIQLSCVLLLFGLVLKRVSKKHHSIAHHAEQFILGQG